MDIGGILARRFRLVQRIGAGGMGVVFRAVDFGAGADVAVKILDSAVDGERARREAEALAGLSHPSIVRYVADGITADGRVFLAMEWIDGTPVDARIMRDGFSLAAAVAVTRQVAIALAAAHAHGIVHRDVKPSNVLMVGGDSSNVKLIDFGIAKITSSAALTRTGTTMGTPGYMAPEQARGSRALGPSADVFSLGSFLYECATGRPAFSGSMAAAVMTKILFSDPVPLARLCPEAPRALCRIVDRMLDKDPVRRLSDGAAVVDALDGLGPLPTTPVRRAIAQPDEVTLAPAEIPTAHCMVVATRGQLDDVLAPPTPEQLCEVELAVVRWRGTCEVLATGAVVGHFMGDIGGVADRANGCADEIHRILPEWITVVSAIEADAGSAADGATSAAAMAVISSIFGRT